MKHLANVMSINEWEFNQESTVGRIFEMNRGRAKKIIIEWLDGRKEVAGSNYLEACGTALKANDWFFVRPV